MPDLITNLALRLLEEPLDAVPRYRLLKDVLQWPADQPDMQLARNQAMQSPHVLALCGSQSPDGSWGRFRRPDDWPVARPDRTTESALVRAQALGMDRDHPAIQRAISYLAGLIDHSISWPDLGPLAVGGASGFELAAAARLSQLDSGHPAVRAVAAKWEDIISASLTGDGIDRTIYHERYERYFGQPEEVMSDRILSAYVLWLLRDRLDYAVSLRLTDYLINRSRGIFLINNRALRYLPLSFQSRECQRYLVALSILADYPSAGTLLESAFNWLWDQMNNNGFWDFGDVARDGLELPLSDSWRRKGSRQADCTVRILSLMVRLQRSCEIRKAICHVL